VLTSPAQVWTLDRYTLTQSTGKLPRFLHPSRILSCDAAAAAVTVAAGGVGKGMGQCLPLP